MQAVAAGKVDFGYADTPALLRTIAAGAEVKSIGVFLQTTPASIQFFADKNIKSVADMKGKSVAGSPGDAAYETFVAVLEANHVPNDAVQRLNVDPAGKLTAVISGRADSLAGFYNDQSPTIEAKTGKKMEQIRYADHGVNFFSTGLVASDAMLKKDPAARTRLLPRRAALVDGSREAPERRGRRRGEARRERAAQGGAGQAVRDHARAAAHAAHEEPADRRERSPPTGNRRSQRSSQVSRA